MSKRNRNRALAPPQQGAGQRTLIAHHEQVRIAPLPAPEELERYNVAVPGLAERIVRMAELNGDDRRATNRVIRWISVLGQIFAFIILMTGLLGGFYFAYIGKSTAGVSAIVTAIAVPLGVFVYNRSKSKPTT